jgi:hypothetical protein
MRVFFLAVATIVGCTLPVTAAPQSTDPHVTANDHNSYFCRSNRLYYPYAETCPEPWIKEDPAVVRDDINPIISCGSGGCSPMDNTDVSRTAAAKPNAQNRASATASRAYPSEEAPRSHIDPTAVAMSLIVAAFGVYFLPWIIAAKRSHHQHGAVAVINIFLGWTFVGWVIALAMACSAVKPAVVPAAGASGGT